MRRILHLTLALGCLTSCTTPISTILQGGIPTASIPPGVPGVGTGNLRATLPSVVLKSGENKDLAPLLRGPDGLVVTLPVVWTSNNESVAQVNTTTGQVRAAGPGTAIITGSLASDPASKVGIEVSVVEKHAVLLVKVDPATPTMGVGQRLPLKAQVTMADGQINGNVVWSSSDDTIATINPTTGELSAIKEGKVTVVAAYTVDPRYKGLSEVTIVKELKATPTPAPSDIVFKPGSTPIPASPTPEPSVTPTPKPSKTPSTAASATPSSDDGEDETGATTGGGVAFTAPAFAAVRDFGYEAVFEFVDFHNVLVAEGTKLSVTSNGGKNWTVYTDVGSQPIRAMHWLSASEGWVAGDNGTILKVKIQDSALSFEVQNSGTDDSIDDIYFASSGVGLFSTGSTVYRTSDQGATWGEPVNLYGRQFAPDGQGSAVYFYGGNYSGTMHHYREGAFVKIEVGEVTQFEKARSADGLAFVKASDGEWSTTKDWETFTPFSSDLKTSTQILRGALAEVYPITDKVLLAQVQVGWETQYVISRDGGKLWSDPKKITTSVGEIVPFGETKMWATSSSRLYRAGTP